jgi:Asp-tRNA(Asn)/Glu-tRNA(Gln) amidotransferase A subunit family amidase
MADVDVVVSLVSPVPPPLLGSEPAGDLAGDGLRQAILGYTTAQILAGLPACSVPIGFDELQLPVGLQLTGVPAGEEVIVSVAQLLQGATPDVAGVWPESCLGVPVS